MNPLFQIDIPKRNTSCCSKGERLTSGMEYYSLLIEDEDQKLVRKDFCTTCWFERISKKEFPENKGYWKSKIEIKKEVNAKSRIDRALVLLQSLIQNQKEHEAEIFVLAMFLAHARRLALRKEIEHEGEKFGLYEILRQDEFVTIKIIPLTHLEIEGLQRSLASKLK
jgi:hypothetical protein